MATDSSLLDSDLAGLDALELAEASERSRVSRLWSATWPKVAAIALALLGWQAVVWSGWRPVWALAPPGPVLSELARLLGTGDFWKAVAVTGRRALTGYALAVVIGCAVGVAVGSFITGLQTMPSIAWFPLAIVLFKLTEGAILFVVVLGATPSIANGLIGGVDHVPPLLVRAGRTLGASGLSLYRHVVLPASLPAFVGGPKQGWAFAWRSLMAGELLVIVANRPSIGATLQYSRDNSDAELMGATMIVILVLGILVDTAFVRADNRIRSRYGLVDAAA